MCRIKIIIVVLLFLQAHPSFAQLTITPTSTSAALAAKLTGTGVTIISDTLICDALANGTFVSSATPITIDSGIILSTGRVAQATGAESALTSTSFSGAGDPDLLPYTGTATTTADACELIIHFVPRGDTISFRYQFGSEEYRQSTCGLYNDAFAFFISGPGISSSLPGVNMALVPGSTIPVAVNSVNNGVIGTTTGCAIANCTSMGPGSPFTAFYINNAGGTQVAYRGYTNVFSAIHSVTPCDTYRIKMSIVDAGNGLYDSGVFIEAGSLVSNTFTFNHTDSNGHTINGLPHTIVKGCDSATVTINASTSQPFPQSVNLVLGGTAVNGVDIATLATSIILPANSTTVSFGINGITGGTVGTKTLMLYILSSCGTADSLLINVLDSPGVRILTPDTNICTNDSITLRTSGSPGLIYSWAPASTLDSATAPQPVSTPTAPVVYTLTASLPGSGCPVMVNTVRVFVSSPGNNMLTILPLSDSVFCQGVGYTFVAGNTNSNGYIWSFGPGDSIKNVNPVVHAFGGTGIYTVTLSPLMPLCGDTLNIKTIQVFDFPGVYLGSDTVICVGSGLIQLGTPSGSTHMRWLWNTGETTPVINVTEPGKYYLKVSEDGCANTDSIVIGNDCYMDIPNIFTPNGDGLNDYFFPRQFLTRGLTKFSMNIYNRWGQVVFTSESTDGRGWDGTFNSLPQPTGCFVYVIDALFKDGQKANRTGNVTLMR